MKNRLTWRDTKALSNCSVGPIGYMSSDADICTVILYKFAFDKNALSQHLTPSCYLNSTSGRMTSFESLCLKLKKCVKAERLFRRSCRDPIGKLTDLPETVQHNHAGLPVNTQYTTQNVKFATRNSRIGTRKILILSDPKLKTSDSKVETRESLLGWLTL